MPEHDVLDSWKEIAAYLERSEKTCRRLERELGLPVHRLEETPKARVYAYKDEIDSWKQKTQHSEKEPLTLKEITVSFSLKKIHIPALIALILFIITLIIWQPWPKGGITPIPSDKPSLAIMYFENNTGDENLNHWRKGISDLLITDLTQSKYLRVLGSDKLYDILSGLNQAEAKRYSSQILKEVASRGEVNNIVRGSYSKAGDTIRIDIVLQNAITGEPITTDRVEGMGEESIFSLVDELTRRVKAGLNFSESQIANDVDKQIGKVTTNSPLAYKYFLEGWKHKSNSDFRRSIEFLEKAVEIDPEFAFAYRAMAICYQNLGYRAENLKYHRIALDFTDRMSVREQYQIEASLYFQSEKNWNKAVDIWLKLLDLFPDDFLGNNGLGSLYHSLEEWDKSIERLGVILNTKAFSTAVNLADSYLAIKKYDKAKEVLEFYINKYPGNVWNNCYLAISYLIQELYHRAHAEVDKAFLIAPNNPMNLCTKGDIYLCQGYLVEAKETYQKLLDLEESEALLFGYYKLGLLKILKGEFEKSKDVIEDGIRLAYESGRQRWISRFHLQLAYVNLVSGSKDEISNNCELAMSNAIEVDELFYQKLSKYFEARSYLKLNRMDRARESLDDLMALIELGTNKKDMRLYHNLMGLISLKNNDFLNSIENAKKALALLPYQTGFGIAMPYSASHQHALIIDLLALAYYKQGNFDKALDEYERITHLTTGRLYYGDVYAKSFYMLGIIYEQKNSKPKAIENYEKFLELWKDADPGIAEVEGNMMT